MQSRHAFWRLILPQSKLPPGANRILFVKNLNYQITGEDLYDLFGRYGSIRQIRIGNEQKTKGTAFVVFDDVMDVRGVFFYVPLCTHSDILGEECFGTLERLPLARAIYRRIIPHARKTGRSRCEG